MKTRINKHGKCRGIALMMVMLVVFVLTAIVAGFAYSMKVEMRLAHADTSDSDLEWVARGAVEVARFALSQKPQNERGIDALNQVWAGGTGSTNDPLLELGIDLKNIDFGEHAKASVTIVDMERKWNINRLASSGSPQDTMIVQQALNIMGVADISESATITDSIFDWVDRDDMRRFNGAENDYYINLDPPYFCKDGLIDDLSELLLIKGVTPEMYSASTVRAAYQLRKSSSPFDRDDEIPVYPYHFDDLFTTMGQVVNINTASAAVLQLVPGMDPDSAEQMVQARAGPDGVDGTDDDLPFRSVPVPAVPPGQPPPAVPGGAYLGVTSTFFEVKVEAEVNGYKRTYFAVLQRAGANGSQIIRFYSE